MSSCKKNHIENAFHQNWFVFSSFYQNLVHFLTFRVQDFSVPQGKSEEIMVEVGTEAATFAVLVRLSTADLSRVAQYQFFPLDVTWGLSVRVCRGSVG